MTKFSGAVYRNGDFTIGAVPRRLKPRDILPLKGEAPPDTETTMESVRLFGIDLTLQVRRDGATLGLSNVPIPHRRSRKGLKGMTSHGRRMVRNGCFELEERFGRGRCGFGTFTLPTLNLMDYAAVCQQWPAIVKVFIQRLKRRLTARGIKPYIVYVTEFQTERYEKEKRAYPHLHICYPARPERNYNWYLPASELRNIWKQVIESRCLSAYDFDASVDCVVVKKSVGAYLAKYLSKGAGDIARFVEAGLPLGCIGHWWGVTGELRAQIASGIRRSPDMLRHLWRSLPRRCESGGVVWCRYVSIETRAAGERVIGACGMLDGPSVKELCLAYPRNGP